MRVFGGRFQSGSRRLLPASYGQGVKIVVLTCESTRFDAFPELNFGCVGDGMERCCRIGCYIVEPENEID
jgi:non-ribosomal peptide synthetase component F